MPLKSEVAEDRVDQTKLIRLKLNNFLEHRYFEHFLSTYKKVRPRHGAHNTSSVCARYKFLVWRLDSTDCFASTALNNIYKFTVNF